MNVAEINLSCESIIVPTDQVVFMECNLLHFNFMTIVTNQSNFVEIFRGKTDILEQEVGSFVKISYPNIDVVVLVIITFVLNNRNGRLHSRFW